MEKQIEEMAKDFCAVGILCEECHLYRNRCHAKKYATRAYNTGYRKASEVAEEIFAEIENAHEECIHLDTSTNIGYLLQTKFEHKLAELKKKYTESEDPK